MLPIEKKIARAYGLSDKDAQLTVAAINRLMGELIKMGVRIKIEDVLEVDYKRADVDNFIIGKNKAHIRRALQDKNSFPLFINPKRYVNDCRKKPETGKD